MGKESEKIDITDEIGYYSIGGTGVPTPKHRKIFTYEGIKNIFERIQEGDYVEVLDWNDYSEECEKVQYHRKVNIIRKK